MWGKEYYDGIGSEKFVENVIYAYLHKRINKQQKSLKWVGGELEIWSSFFKDDPEKRKKEILRAINRYGMNHEEELIGEMMRRELI